MNKRIIIIAWDDKEYLMLYNKLRSLNYRTGQLTRFRSIEDMVLPHGEDADILLACLPVADEVAIRILKTLKNDFPILPVVVLMPGYKEETALQLIREGAQDCLCLLDPNDASLGHSMNHAIERTRYIHGSATPTWIDIVESITDAFCAVDANWNILYVNGVAERFYNMPREQFLHQNMWDLFKEGAKYKYYEAFQRALTEQVTVEFEEYSPHTGKWLAVKAFPTKVGLSIYFSDMTEKKKLKDKVLNDEHNLRAIINNTKDVIWSVDMSRITISANQAFYDRVALMTKKKDYADIVFEEDINKEQLERWRGYYNRALGGEAFKVVEKEIWNGVNRYDEIRFNPIHDKDGHVVGATCFSRDITKQRNQLLKIERQNAQLKEIAWIQSHEVRGPVATILGLIELFNTDDPTDPENTVIIKGIKESTTRLDEIVKEVVDKTNDIE